MPDLDSACPKTPITTICLTIQMSFKFFWLISCLLLVSEGTTPTAKFLHSAVAVIAPDVSFKSLTSPNTLLISEFFYHHNDKAKRQDQSNALSGPSNLSNRKAKQAIILGEYVDQGLASSILFLFFRC